MKSRYWLGLISISALTLLFQNCSNPVEFTSIEDELQVVESCIDASCAEVSVKETSVRRLESAPHDILFVIDDSSSMRPIIDLVKEGFSSIRDVAFPSNTRMAVTYMSVDKFNEDGTIMSGVPFTGGVVYTKTPGHLKLVSAESILAYLAEVTDRNSANIVLPGCNSEWFSPNDVNAVGDRCLDAAVQSPLYSTGVEAGFVSLEQLITNYNTAGKRLFRSRALAHIVFVSDTHEPGGTYWGKPGALAKQRSLVEIQSFINANSRNLSSVKFSGVLPVPHEGSPYLTPDLKVIGPVPATEEDSYVSSENRTQGGIYRWWDYSYLTAIKTTGGVIIHPKTGDWRSFTEQLVEESFFTGNIVVTLTRPILRINSVRADGVLLTANQYSISTDRRSLNLRISRHSTQSVAIEVDYSAAGTTP